MDKMNKKIVVVGLNHKTACIEDREILEIKKDEIRDSLKFIFQLPEISEIVILHTCNRLEFYMVMDKKLEAIEVIRTFYKNHRNFALEEKSNVFYSLHDQDATKHLFKVICGLDSLVLGEYQIQGQVKDAYSLACDVKSLDTYLHKLFHAAFRCGKTVRSQTSLGKGKQSVSGVAAGLFIENCKPQDTVAVIGVNENTRIMASELSKAGFSNLIYVNRTYYKAEMMAEEFGGKALALDKIMYVLSNSDAVYSCTGAPGFIVNSQMLHSLAKRQLGPKLIIDMAVPRDFNTAGLDDSINTYDISDLKVYLEQQEKKQSEDIPKALRIIENEVNVFSAWTNYSGSDLLKPYAERFEKTRLQILDEYRSQFPEQSFEKIDKLSRQMLHRFQSTFISALTKKNNK